MAKILNIIFSSVLLLPSAVRATATCYSRDGIPNSDIPCSSGSDISMCCGSGSTCYSNGMCGPVNNSGSRALSLGSCTDHTWNSKKCLDVCPQGLSGHSQALYTCDSGEFCCGTDSSCCSGKTFNLAALDPIATIVSVETATATPASENLLLVQRDGAPPIETQTSGTVTEIVAKPTSAKAQSIVTASAVVTTNLVSIPVTISVTESSPSPPTTTAPAITSAPIAAQPFSGTILIDTSSPGSPAPTTAGGPPPFVSASTKPSSSQPSNLLKIVLPVVAVVALIVATCIFVFMIRQKYKSKPSQEDDFLEEWPEVKRGTIRGGDRETKARFSFLSFADKPLPEPEKPLPQAPSPVAGRPYWMDLPNRSFAPQELEGSQVSLVRYSVESYPTTPRESKAMSLSSVYSR